MFPVQLGVQMKNRSSHCAHNADRPYFWRITGNPDVISSPVRLVPTNALLVRNRNESRHADFHDRSLSRGQKLSRRASEERGYKTLSDFSPRVLASQPWFLFPD